MSTVTALPGVIMVSDRRAFFLNEIATSFDLYVRDYGYEPDSFVIVMGGIKQTARCSYTMRGESQAAATTMLALAGAVVAKEVINPA